GVVVRVLRNHALHGIVDGGARLRDTEEPADWSGCDARARRGPRASAVDGGLRIPAIAGRGGGLDRGAGVVRRDYPPDLRQLFLFHPRAAGPRVLRGVPGGG